MKDLTQWGIVKVGALTASGYDEIQVRTIRKADCETWLRARYSNLGEARRDGLFIKRVAEQVTT